MAAWKTTAELRRAAYDVFDKLQKGEIDADAAKALGSQLRTATKLVALEVDVAKIKGNVGLKLKPVQFE